MRTQDGTVDTIDAFAVISAVGALNHPHLPDIPGMDDFAGPSFHSARWDSSVDIRGKRFALIGAGASGFQIAPTIADEVEQLTVFQRTAQWMFPNDNYHAQVPDGERWAMRHLPFYGRWFRFLTFYPGSGLTHRTFPHRSRLRRQRRPGDQRDEPPDGGAVRPLDHRADRRRPRPPGRVMPDYPATAKRMLQDNGSWLACLKKDNVELVRTGIERIVEDGVVTVDGAFHPADVICYATGFLHNDYLWPMTIVGRGGRVLREQWGIEPTAYLGITVPNFPNLFCLYGPGTNLAHGGSLIFQSECQVNYIMEALRSLLEGHHRTMEPKPEVHDEYRRALRGRDLADGVGALVGEALALQEPRRPHLHPVAVADPDVLGVDERHRPRRLHRHVAVAHRASRSGGTRMRHRLRASIEQVHGAEHEAGSDQHERGQNRDHAEEPRFDTGSRGHDHQRDETRTGHEKFPPPCSHVRCVDRCRSSPGQYPDRASSHSDAEADEQCGVVGAPDDDQQQTGCGEREIEQWDEGTPGFGAFSSPSVGVGS